MSLTRQKNPANTFDNGEIPPEATKMAPRAKARATQDPHKIVTVGISVGDWIDVMDAEGTWNVAQVLSLPTSKEVEVKYDGWGAEYNEVVALNSERIAPYHTYTWSVKCWAKYKNWPWWPSIVTIRSPGTLAGQQYLENESRLFVDFLDRKDIPQRCRVWVEQAKVKPFEDHYDDRRKRSTGSDFETSLTRAHKSKASTKFPTFTRGTLPLQYKTRTAEPVKVLKKEMGLNKWLGSFNTNRQRHCAVYRYKADGVVSDGDSEDDDEEQVVQFVELSDNDDGAPKKARAKGKGKAPPRATAKKLTTGGKNSTVKQEAALGEPVVKIEDSALIVEGPHAPSPKTVTEEEPLYLSPIEEQLDGIVPPISSNDVGRASRLRRGTKTAISSIHDIEQPRQRESRLSNVASEASTRVLGHSNYDGLVEECADTGVDASELETTTGEEQSEETTSTEQIRTGGDEVLDDGGDKALIEDINADDDSDADESDLIPIDTLDEVDCVPGTRNEAAAKQNVAIAVPTSAASVMTFAETPESQDTAREQDTIVNEAQTDEALLVLKEVSNSLAVSLESESLAKADKVPAKLPKSTRKSAKKSLAEETIAAAQAALADMDSPVPNKKRRIEKQEKKTATSRNTSSTSKKPSEPAIENHPQNATDISAAPIETHHQEAKGNLNDQDSWDTTRRFSMRAGAKDTNENPNKQGKTPVWVLPPPKFDPSPDLRSLPLPTSSILSPRPFPPPFSSLSLFGSAVDFSLKEWFKRDKYPHYLAQ